MITRYQIQLLRYINLTDKLSARMRGLTKDELYVLAEERLVDFPIEGYQGHYVRVSQRGQQLLESCGAHTFANPDWDDDPDFRKMLEKQPI
jgi:hypothetical protein